MASCRVLAIVVALFTQILSIQASVLPWAPSPDGIVNSTIIPPSNRSTSSPIVPNTYIVQLYSSGELDPHSQFHRKAKRDAGLSYTTRQTYKDNSLFLGLSLTLDSADDYATLKGLESVAGVWPVYEFARPSAALKAKPLDLNKRFTTVPVDGTNLTIPYITGNLDVNRPHQMAGVDQVQATGVKGKGIKIAVIDTGVDFRHPSLGGGFGSGYKIEFGYDFVGDDYPTTTVESPEPLSTCIGGGHGTHVMGIIGMEDQPGTGFGLIGVAPEATLGMYRVFGCSGGAGSDVIISAFMQAAADSADVVSLSLGSDVSFEDTDPFYTVTNALNAQGIAIVAATGNDASYGIYVPSAPASGPGVFAVGSVENEKFPVTYQLSDSNGRELRYSAVLPLNSSSEGLTVQIMNYGGSLTELLGCYEEYYADAAANLTAVGIDPSTVILATLNGGCVSYSKGQVAQSYGFNYLLSYITTANTVWGQEFGDVDPEVYYNITPIITDLQDSTTILGSYGKHPLKYKIYFDNQNYVAESPTLAPGGFMSNYSSFGPVQDFELNYNLKPQLSSPGGLILATWPLELDGYAVISGTSMATPFMAGCYALLKSQYPDLTVNETYALLQNSGTQMAWYYDQSILSSTAHQGAGLVNIHNAITWESLVTPSQLSLGDSAQTVTANLTIWNRSTRSKTYTFSHKAAGLMQEDLNIPDPVINQMYPVYATASFPTPSVTIHGGAKVEVSVLITPPQNVAADFRPIYTGYIIVKNNYETYSIPYVGHPYSYGKAGNSIALMAPAQLYPSEQILNELAPSVRPYANYRGIMAFTAAPDTSNKTFPMGDYGYLGVLWGTTTTSDFIRFDLVPANTSFVPDLYGFNKDVVSVPPEDLVYPTTANITYQTVLGLEDVVEILAEFEGPFDVFQSEGFWWDNPLYLPNADYRIVMRVLPTGGDYNDSTAWDSWLSAIITINTDAEYAYTPPGTGLGSF